MNPRPFCASDSRLFARGKFAVIFAVATTGAAFSAILSGNVSHAATVNLLEGARVEIPTQSYAGADGHVTVRGGSAAEFPDLYHVPPDLVVPAVMAGAAQPGCRVRQTTAGWQGTAVNHVLYLPTDWRPGERYPVIVEYAGNGGFKNAFGDVCDGTVDHCDLGYGLTAGKEVIWICLPFVEEDAAGKRNATNWWGDVEETKRYCLATVRAVCADFGGDPAKVVLAGFSRGSIACNYIGLHDDTIAALWCAFFCHSHYDGVIERWRYPAADRAAAAVRLRRLKGRPQWISHEGSVAATQDYLRGTGVAGDFTFQAVPFRNHSDQWVLRDLPERRAARLWLQHVLALPKS